MVTERSRELLKRLVSIRSVSGSEESIQLFLEDFLQKRGLQLHRQRVDRKRFNLFYRGSSPYLISCHVDTVPPLGMKGAFVPVERDGRIYGRGSADVKGAIASLLTAIEIFRERYPSRRLPVSLAFVVDEENNSALGSLKILELLEHERYCLVLEPTYGVLCTSQMGSFEFSVRVRGRSVHASEFERTENPVKVCFEIVRLLEEKLSRPVNVLLIRGGSGHYAVPGECRMLLEVRIYEGERGEDLEERIREILKEAGGSCEILWEVEDVEEFIRFRSEGFVEFLEEVHETALGERPARGTMPSWTDASNYHRAGLGCVVFGYGSLEDCHTSRESIAVEDLQKMSLFLTALFERLR